MAKKLLVSAEENQNDENQFELDEQAIDEISNAEEFADVEISNEDIMDAVEAIDALAAAVIDKADGEEKEVNADELLDTITEMIDDTHEEEPAEETEEVDFSEEEKLPEEIESSVVHVMVSDDGEVDIEQKPDEVYQSEVDGLDATVFDTTDDYNFAVEDTASADDIGDDTLIIGNSDSKKMKKGYITIKSSANKKVWSSAFKKVKKMVGSAKFTAAHWAIVSAIAAKAEAEAKLNKQIQSKLVNYIKSNKDLKAKFMSFIKSDVAGQDTQPEVQPEGQTESEAKPDMTAEPQNNGFEETTNDGVPPESGDPEGVTSQSGNPTEDPDRQDEREDEIVLPEESIVVVDVPLTNSVRHVKLEKIRSSKKGYNLYKVVNSKDSNILDGKVIKSGNIAYCFRAGINNMLVCCAKFVSNGKGTYKPILKNNKIVISRGGELAPVFQNYEKICLAKQIVSSRKEGFEEGKKASIMSARRNPETPARKPVVSARKPVAPDTNKQLVKSDIMRRRAERNEQRAIKSQAKLQKMHEAEERQRLFQSSQTQLNEERIAIKSNNARNAATLDKLYKGMF